jgi:hypothetical protein
MASALDHSSALAGGMSGHRAAWSGGVGLFEWASVSHGLDLFQDIQLSAFAPGEV